MIDFLTFLILGGLLLAVVGAGFAILVAIGGLLLLPFAWLASAFRSN